MSSADRVLSQTLFQYQNAQTVAVPVNAHESNAIAIF